MAKVFEQETVTIATLNAIRTNASGMYQEFVPVATRNNITAVAEAILDYDPKMNEFIGLLNKIAQTMTIKRMFENKLARFKSGELDTAATIEEYYTRKVKAVPQDPTGSNPLGKRNVKADVVYYSENRSDTYETTTSFKQIRKALRSIDGVEKLLNELVADLYDSANIDEYEIMKNLLAQVHTKATVYEVPDAAESAANARRVVKTIRKASNDMEEPTNKFHTHYIEKDGTPGTYERNEKVIAHTPKANQVLFINKDVESEISVEVLASAFNSLGVENPMEQVIVGDFGDEAEGIIGVLADDRLLRVFDTYRELLSQENAQGAFVNHFLHIDQILALSPFANVIVFKIKEDNGGV